jgi:hypothetical protein
MDAHQMEVADDELRLLCVILAATSLAMASISRELPPDRGGTIRE